MLQCVLKLTRNSKTVYVDVVLLFLLLAFNRYFSTAEAYSEPSQTSNMEFFAKIVSCLTTDILPITVILLVFEYISF